MRLLNTMTIKLEEFNGPKFPKYAILSHTWDNDEVSFQDIGLPGTSTKQGFQKVRTACRLASKNGFDYVWVDTCCIDKSSSSELSEAINSMFYWYRSSAVCFAYLSDLRASKPDYPQLHKCRWFSRGWTLQELIAPRRVEFYDAKWNLVGTKKSLEDRLHKITGIDKEVLRDCTLISTIPIAKKMAWASSRETTRIEDTAYCLLGIFNVNIPLLYGERENAFQRLQEEIVRTTHDTTIFAWESHGYSHKYSGIFAKSPREFAIGGDLTYSSIQLNTDGEEFSVTNKGVKILSPLLYSDDYPGVYILPIGQGSVARGKDKLPIGIYLAKFGINSFVRARHNAVYTFKTFRSCKKLEERVIYVLRTIDENMYDSVRRQRCSAICFNFCSTISVNKVTPQSLWDCHRNTVLVPSAAKPWAFICIHVDCEEKTTVDIQRPLTEHKDTTLCLFFWFTNNSPTCYFFTFEDPKDLDRLHQMNSINDWDMFTEMINRQSNGVATTAGHVNSKRLGINESRTWLVEGRCLFLNLTESEGDDRPAFRLTIGHAADL